MSEVVYGDAILTKCADMGNARGYSICPVDGDPVYVAVLDGYFHVEKLERPECDYCRREEPCDCGPDDCKCSCGGCALDDDEIRDYGSSSELRGLQNIVDQMLADYPELRVPPPGLFEIRVEGGSLRPREPSDPRGTLPPGNPAD